MVDSQGLQKHKLLYLISWEIPRDTHVPLTSHNSPPHSALLLPTTSLLARKTEILCYLEDDRLRLEIFQFFNPTFTLREKYLLYSAWEMHCGAPCLSLLWVFLSFSRPDSVSKNLLELNKTKKVQQHWHGVSFALRLQLSRNTCCSVLKKKARKRRLIIYYVKSQCASLGLQMSYKMSTVDGMRLLCFLQRKELGIWCRLDQCHALKLWQSSHLQMHFDYLGLKQQQQQQSTNHKPIRWLNWWEVCQLCVYLCTAFTKITR